MKPSVKVKKGFTLNLDGAPKPEIVEADAPAQVAVLPTEFSGVKARLKVKEGDTVKRGSLLFIDKKKEARRFLSPAGGRISSIQVGKRRVIEKIVIDVDSQEQDEAFKKYSLQDILDAQRDELATHLQQTGLLALIRQRPFLRLAEADVTPKCIFVNGMNTAPFDADLHVAVQGEEQALQAGLAALNRLTDGDVHLCLAAGTADHPHIARLGHTKVHTFEGPHPAGNTSVHMAHIAPYQKGDVIWEIKALDVILLGKLLLSGTYPSKRVISLSGPSVKASARKYYRIRIGAPLTPFLNGKLADGRHRVINGNVFSGTQLDLESSLPFRCTGLTVLREDRDREFMGWLAPGVTKYSRSRTFLSSWVGKRDAWNLTTNRHGSARAMVLTGLYDKYMPLNIMVDFLVRAVLAHDTEEAIALGILETAPEDYALCAFVCPSKMDIPSIIRDGLAEIEKEGF